MDPRLDLAETLEREAAADFALGQWLAVKENN
jgi:hypothetical protein